MVAIALKAQAVVGAAGKRFPLVHRGLRALALLTACSALALGGLWVGLRLSAAASYRSALGTASFQLEPSSQGTVEVFIPLADWGLRAHAFGAPLKLHVEPRVLNRQAVIAAAQGNAGVLSRTRTDLAADARRALERAARFMLLGVLIAAIGGWALVRSYHSRSRRLLLGIPAGTVLVAVMIGATLLWRVSSTWNSDALAHPTYYARGAELIQLLNAAEHSNRIKDSYASKVEGTLSGFASLLTNPDAGTVDGDRRALLVSDLHNNTLALSSLAYYAQRQPVFFPGDFGNTGDASEISALVPSIARLGSKVIAVSGNHDSAAMMLALARRGVVVLTSHGQLLPNGRYGKQEVFVGGVRVAGFEDPVEYRGTNPDSATRIFSLGQLPSYPQAYSRVQQRLLAWFRGLPRRPDVVLIHENGLAQYLAQTLYGRGYSAPLTILTGHDHIQHVNHDGPIDVVDAGTVGASGPYGLGSDYVGLADLHWASGAPVLHAADLIQTEPVSGVAQAQRVVLSTDCGLSRTDCTSAVDYLDPREGPKTSSLRGAQPISPLRPVVGAKVP
jgi:Calcineurin-like phosphoesterase superfamily domain